MRYSTPLLSKVKGATVYPLLAKAITPTLFAFSPCIISTLFFLANSNRFGYLSDANIDLEISNANSTSTLLLSTSLSPLLITGRAKAIIIKIIEKKAKTVLVFVDKPFDEEVNFFNISGLKIVCSTLFLVVKL